jgi:uncharacterized membrane protein
MPRFCSQCGAQVPDTANACPACGKTMAAGVGGGAAAAPAVAPAQQSGDDGLMGLLCYSPVGLFASIFFLVADPYKSNKFIRFHAFQALLTVAAFFVLYIGLGIVGSILGMIAGPLALIIFPVYMLLGFGSIVLFVVMMVKAYQRQMTKLPVVGAMAAKQAGL